LASFKKRGTVISIKSALDIGLKTSYLYYVFVLSVINNQIKQVMKFITIFCLAITYGFAIQAQDVFEVKWTMGITQYRCAYIMNEDGTGKMRCRYFNEGVTQMVEQTMEIEDTPDGTRLTGYDPVYPGTSTPFPDYSPDNLYLWVDDYGNFRAIAIDNERREANATMRLIEGSSAINIFLKDFDWDLNSISNQKQIYFKNECKYKLKLAICYRYNDVEWTTKYWYSIDAFKGTYLASDGVRLKTNNSIVYIYAEIIGGTAKWTGDVRTYFDGQYYNMLKYEMTVDSDGDYYISLSCSNLN
jgi:hypothetical protein